MINVSVTVRRIATFAVLHLSLLRAVEVRAQHETDKWYFGTGGEGLNFTDRCDPEVLSDGSIQGFEGCATMADRSTGELLFYTNSRTIWDRSHQPMPNGDLHSPDVTAYENTITQVMVTERPGSGTQYYVFTNLVQCGFFGGIGMRLACVDMTLNSGYGDVLFKDSMIYTDTVSEKLTAIRHANDEDLWVIGHGYPNNEFFAILITNQGVTNPPVLSHVGKIYGNLSGDCIGEMKASPDGDKIAVVTIAQPHIELFDFDRSTGIMSGPILIGSSEIPAGGNSWLYGVSFSPNGSKLYAGRKNFGGGAPSILQVDVTSNDSAQIAASRTVISTLDDVYSLQLAPNGKIYGRRTGFSLGAINYPDSAGLACGFEPAAVQFGQAPGYLGTWGLNNNIAPTYYPCLRQGIGMDEVDPDAGAFSIYPNPCQSTVTLVLAAEVYGDIEVLLYDGSGRKMCSVACSARKGRCDLDLSSIANGIYSVWPTIDALPLGRPLQIAVVH